MNKKLGHKTWCKDKFITEAKKKFGNKFDYSLVFEFVNYKRDKVKIKCNDCGNIFEITPHMHLKSGVGGCKICSKKKKWTTKEFIDAANNIHNYKYDYSLVNIEDCYKNKTEFITVICPEHGKFQQKWKLHLRGCGCKKCFQESQFKTTEEFIKRAIEIHGNKYDYSQTEYKGRNYDIKIICPKHGEFITKAARHLLGCGCYKCSHNFDFYNAEKLSILTKYDLEGMDWSVILDLIGENKLPSEFKCLCKFGSNTSERKEQIKKLIETYNIEPEKNDEIEETPEILDDEIIENEVSDIFVSEFENESIVDELKPYKDIETLGSLLNINDKDLYSTGDKYEHIFNKEMSKLWGLILRDNENHSIKNIDIIKTKVNSDTITPFSKHIYSEFLKQYDEVVNFEVH